MDIPNRFHLEIDGLEEFIAFCAALRLAPIEESLHDLAARLTAATGDLADAYWDATSLAPVHAVTEEESHLMAVPKILTDLDTAVTNATTVQASAATLIRGFASRQQAAIDQALANGATAEQLAPVQAEVDALNTGAADLSAAVAENTPAA